MKMEFMTVGVRGEEYLIIGRGPLDFGLSIEMDEASALRLRNVLCATLGFPGEAELEEPFKDHPGEKV